MSLVKDVFRLAPLYYGIRTSRHRKALREWQNRGRGGPPPHFLKQLIVKEYARRFSIQILVETGTYLGDMIHSAKDTFRNLISIELDQALFDQARRRFAKFERICMIHGDSGEVFPEILADLKEPCLFWLDAHYSLGITAKGKVETPILRELHHIVNHPIRDHVILIDDARLFVGRNSYPTLEELHHLIRRTRPYWIP